MSYNFFAGVYDELTFNVEYDKRGAYIKKLLSINGCASGTLLDLACGTGTLSKILQSFGYDMILIDSSPEMLSCAREKMKPETLLLCQDMTAIDLFGTINCAVCSLDSVNHLTTPDKVKKAFAGVSLFMEKGGVFVFDVNTPYKHENVLGNNVFIYEKNNIYCVWQNLYKPKSKTVDIKLDIFTCRNGLYERRSESFSERAYELSDIEKWLEESGFEIKSIFGDMTFERPENNSQRVYFTAVKK